MRKKEESKSPLVGRKRGNNVRTCTMVLWSKCRMYPGRLQYAPVPPQGRSAAPVPFLSGRWSSCSPHPGWVLRDRWKTTGAKKGESGRVGRGSAKWYNAYDSRASLGTPEQEREDMLVYTRSHKRVRWIPICSINILQSLMHPVGYIPTTTHKHMNTRQGLLPQAKKKYNNKKVRKKQNRSK